MEVPVSPKLDFSRVSKNEESRHRLATAFVACLDKESRGARNTGSLITWEQLLLARQ